MNLRRRYKIQDVIKRRQILLVQVVKEERGNKGAALTTYLSLAGRYSVLMPNTSHGGGISRKISSSADRKRLKSIMSDLKLPPTMGCIVRTRGSSAPNRDQARLRLSRAAVGRDSREYAQVVGAGAGLWRQRPDQACDPRHLQPRHRGSDRRRRGGLPPRQGLHEAADAEPCQEGEALFGCGAAVPARACRGSAVGDVPSVVQLKSGGYLVINPTEALVSIDINSGRSTREHNRADRDRDQSGSDAGNRPPAAPARHGRARRHRLHRHGPRIERPEGREGDEGGAQERSRAHPGRPHQCLRPDGDEPPAAAHRRARGIDRDLPALRGHGSRPHRLVGGPPGSGFYVLNKKRADIAEIEDRYGVTVEILSDGELEGARMSHGEHGERQDAEDAADEDGEAEPEEAGEAETLAETAADEGETRKRRRRAVVAVAVVRPARVVRPSRPSAGQAQTDAPEEGRCRGGSACRRGCARAGGRSGARAGCCRGSAGQAQALAPEEGRCRGGSARRRGCAEPVAEAAAEPVAEEAPAKPKAVAGPRPPRRSSRIWNRPPRKRPAAEPADGEPEAEGEGGEPRRGWGSAPSSMIDGRREWVPFPPLTHRSCGLIHRVWGLAAAAGA
ncbi:ribonuclease e/G family domain-containing protein [Ditylenchus destructor]|uniref:Ribonuclease e/G family domain-containing protein n=1 Tax=Ditylenchus destructor TaxID=166010 RepID=A0AAD4QVZ4_9BILA|nr:ribonuclease e/G family domain-containing protein [Ditylenchus destructor]